MVKMNVPTTGSLRVDKHERGEEEPRQHTERKEHKETNEREEKKREEQEIYDKDTDANLRAMKLLLSLDGWTA